jgi:hypothetical protein
VSGERCILSLKYVPTGSASRLSSFLRYVQFRDQHADVKRDLGGLTKYIAHRDRTAPGGRLFGPRGNAGDLDRRALLAHISRSLRQGGGKFPRAAYRMVLSPEQADGLDLKALTRAAMDELGRHSGGTPPWIAAIHRNTKHPHVHIVMAARRELEPGRFKTVVINRERLAGMKSAVAHELVRERGGKPFVVRFHELLPTGSRSAERAWGHNRAQRFGLIGGLGQIVDRGLHALATQQRQELRRWMAEEERRDRERGANRRQIRSYEFER